LRPAEGKSYLNSGAVTVPAGLRIIGDPLVDPVTDGGLRKLGGELDSIAPVTWIYKEAKHLETMRATLIVQVLQTTAAYLTTYLVCAGNSPRSVLPGEERAVLKVTP